MNLRLVFSASLLFLACGELEFNNPNDPRNISHPGGIAYKSFTDSRDGKSYNSVVIGTQTWMAENLNYRASGSFCVDNVERNEKVYRNGDYKDTSVIRDTLVSDGGYCDIYGRLYNWETAKNVCPSGWHLPSSAEWNVLANFVGTNSGTKLKSKSGWQKYYEEDGNGTDDYGFTALPGGCGSSNGTTNGNVGSDGVWWSGGGGATPNMQNDNSQVYSSQYVSCNLYSVRCLKDELCGSTPFNGGTKFCSNGTIYDLCNDKTYVPPNERCGASNAVESKCGNVWIDVESKRCGANNLVETKCGSEYFDESNANLRCQSGVLETKCGATGWYNTKNSNSRCENGVVETKCLTEWFDATNTNLRCRLVSSTCGAYGCSTVYAFEVKCGSNWYDATTYKCDDGVMEAKCGTGYYNPSTQFCSGNTAYDRCNGNTYTPETQRCGAGNVIEDKCGTGYYNPSTQFCYDNTSYDLCKGKTYVISNQRCGANDVVETKCGTGWYDATSTDMRCENDVAEIKCGSGWNGDEWYNAETHRCTGTNGNIVEAKCGTEWYEVNDSKLRCQNNVLETKCGTDDWYNEKTQFCSFVSGSWSMGTYGTYTAIYDVKTYITVTDTRDNQTYRALEIDNQIWMVKNLNYNANGTKCYGNNESNCAIYGRMYDWATAMALPPECNTTSCFSEITEKHQGICPPNWHIPSYAEWKTLTDFAGYYAGDRLKARSGWGQTVAGNMGGSSYSGNGYDSYGFAALGGGYYDGSFAWGGYDGYWWSSSESGDNKASELNITTTSSGGRVSYYTSSKSQMISIRCVKD